MALYNAVLGGGGDKEWKGDVRGRERQAITYIQYYIRNSGLEKDERMIMTHDIDIPW